LQPSGLCHRRYGLYSGIDAGGADFAAVLDDKLLVEGGIEDIAAIDLIANTEPSDVFADRMEILPG
jgi:hypothetical protein